MRAQLLARINRMFGRRRNLIVLSLVPLRADRVGCYGYHRDTTPTLDRLATDGIVYENAYATSAWTPPSHASTMTGLYPWRNGVIGDAPLADGIETMAQYLARIGYATAALVNTHHMGAYKRLDRGFADFRQIGTGGRRARRMWLPRLLERKGFLPKNKGTPATTRQAVAWLERQASGQQPFFLFVHYHEVHHPYRPPRPYRGRYSGERRPPARSSAIGRANLDPHAFFTQQIELSGDDIHNLSDLYDEEVAYLDREHIAHVLGRVRTLGIEDNTVIVVTSPHGESLGEHGLISHVGALYEPLIHVPLIIKVPGMKGASRITSLAQVTDIFPTVARALDLPDPSGALDGVLLPPFAGNAGSRTFVAAEWSGGGFGAVDLAEATRWYVDRPDIRRRFTEQQRALRMGRYKYIEWEHGRCELYDLADDPHETHDIAGREPALLMQLARRLFEVCSSTAQPPSTVVAPAPPELAAELRAQGYKT